MVRFRLLIIRTFFCSLELKHRAKMSKIVCQSHGENSILDKVVFKDQRAKILRHEKYIIFKKKKLFMTIAMMGSKFSA